MTEPTSFEKSLCEAEAACFDALCRIIGLRPGVNAFVGSNRGRTDCAVFDIGAIQTGDQTTYRAGVFHFRGQCDLYSRDRRTLQVWLMRIVAALPVQRHGGTESFLRADTNVIQFRIVPDPTSVSAISTTDVETATAERKITVNTATVTLDIVFRAGTRDTAAAPSPDDGEPETAV